MLLVVTLIVSGLAAAQSSQAFTQPSYEVPLYAHQALSHPDGSMTFEECAPPLSQAYSTQRIMTVDVAGNTLASIAKPSGAAGSWETFDCADAVVAGYDSTIYAVEAKGDGYGNMSYRIAAYKFGIQRWTYSLPACSRYQLSGQPKWLTLGYDGNLYAVMSVTQCAMADQLVGINTSDGTSRFTPIAFTQDVSNMAHWRSQVAMYNSGLVVRDGNTLKYFDYNGQANQTNYVLPLTSGEYFDDAVFAADGTALVAVKKSGLACTGVYRVLTHSPSGANSSFSTVNECPKPGTVRAMPDGGLLLTHQTLYDNSLVRYSATGSLVYSLSVVGITGYSQVWVAWPQVDANGNVIVVRSGINSGGERHSFVDVVSATGTIQRVWDTLSLNTSATGEVLRVEPSTVLIYVFWN